MAFHRRSLSGIPLAAKSGARTPFVAQQRGTHVYISICCEDFQSPSLL